MAHTFPSLIAGPAILDDNPTRATAVLRFPQRELSWVGEVPSGRHGGGVAALGETDLAGQRNFAGIPLAEARQSCGPLARSVLDRIVDVLHRSFGAGFGADRVLVTVRIDKRADYSQSQGAHIDWARLKEFHPQEWGEGAQQSRWNESSFRSLTCCHSIDCVLGGPPTEYFLGQQEGTVLLSRPSGDQPWIVTGMEFPACGAAQPGLTGALLYRPPFTIHQFPSPQSWRSDNPTRLFVSCDYWST